MTKTKNSPMRASTSQRSLRSQSTILNEQLTLLYQLEQRKVAKLENENRALRARITNLLSKEDDERIELLVSDKTRRKLAQLKAITERTIKSLESGLSEFRAFVDDFDTADAEQELDGALEPVKASSPGNSPYQRILQNFHPKLKRIPESPVVFKSTCVKLEKRSSCDADEVEIVDETLCECDEEQADKNGTDDGQQQAGEQAEQSQQDKIDVVGARGLEEEEDEQSLMGEQGDKEQQQQEEEKQVAAPDGSIEKNDGNMEMTNDNAPAKIDGNEAKEDNSIVNETPAAIEMEDLDGADESSEQHHFHHNMPSTVTLRRTTRASTMSTPTTSEQQDKDKTLSAAAECSQLINSHYSTADSATMQSFSTPFSTPQSVNNSSLLNASGRQKRAAVTKVQSYKLPSLSKKMRRPE